MKKLFSINLTQKYEKPAEKTIETYVLNNFTKGIFNHYHIPGYNRGGKTPLMCVDISVINI